MLEFTEQPQPNEEAIKPREIIKALTPQEIIDEQEYVRTGLEAMRNYDQITYEHMLAVADLISEIWKKIGLSAKEASMLMEAGLVHDMGKTNIDQGILFKKGELTDEDWEEVKTHSHQSAKIARENDRDLIAKIVAAHHDHGRSKSAHRINENKIYELMIPERRKIDQQSDKLSNILAIVDNFEGLRSERHYKTSLPLEEVEKILLEKFPTAEDLRVIEALMEVK
jgi:putative nucleotidyltransferase with HDIG domain